MEFITATEFMVWVWHYRKKRGIGGNASGIKSEGKYELVGRVGQLKEQKVWRWLVWRLGRLIPGLFRSPYGLSESYKRKLQRGHEVIGDDD